MNRKLNAAITAGLSLSMVLSSTPVAAIAAETAQGTNGEATAAAATGKRVDYYANGGTFADGSDWQNNYTNENGEVTPSAAPVRDGYVFAGWVYAGTDQVVDFSQPLQGGSDHFMLFAKWTEAPSKVLNVTYAANGGQFADGNNVMQGQTDSNGIARQPLAPTRDGYVFAGWYYHSNGTDPVDFNQPIVGGGKNVTLFAAWTPAKQDKTVEILYVANGGTFFDGNDTMQGVTDTDGIARLPLQPTREGYDFLGWSYDRDGNDPVDFTKAIVAGSGHATVYAQWKQNNEKTVLYVANGGAFADGNETMEGVTDSDGVARQPLAPTREGYTFTGWTYDAAGTEPVDFTKPIPGGGQHVTFFAQWAELANNEKDVLYVANGGVFADGNETLQGVTDGDGVARQPLAPTREGYTFAGWTYDRDGNDPVDFSKPLVGGGDHATLFAQWSAVEKDNSIDVLYVANGGTFFDGRDALQGVTDGDGVARQPLAPTREGYTFAGWTYDSEGTDPVDFSKPLVGGGDHATLFAQWTEDKGADVDENKNVKDVLYFANGGVFFDGNVTLQGVTDSDGVARQPLAPTREGYTFAGWTYDSEGTDPVDFSKPVQGGGDHVTFYAQWTKNETPAVQTHKVNFYVDGSTTTVEVEDGKTVAQPTDPSVDGFNFVGWSSSKESFKKFDFSTPITEDTTVYAFFTAKTPKSETLKKDEGKKQVAADKKDEAKAEKKDDAALASTGDPTFVVTSAAALTGAVAVAVGMYMTKRREH
ncbi:InlB B-repeat-containing protein [Collinsella aerofaciens]|uniref:InlB B-repeat-containing protein n=1 Tax=Collinsella aerofaciens TaxID=74426 RepID=UPI00232BEDF5|nr:InlB B-repeat-containing protein [Collinsella aerofaciens]MDB1856779.1 InlB B-repeat-containing protein [Collinsella aerofaciens]